MDRSSSSRSRWEYVDFDLEIREGGPRKYPVSVRSPVGEAQEEMRFPFDERELENKLLALENALLRSGGTRRRILSPEEQTVQHFGGSLFQALFVGQVRSHYAVSLAEARRQNKGLRLKLYIRPPELTVLPWEFLYDPGRDEYPCLSLETPLVRYVDLREPVEQLTVTPPLRILGMVASPVDLDPLNVDHEKRLLSEATKELQAKGLVELQWADAETFDDLLEEILSGPWHVFHFIGHGGFIPSREEGAIVLSDEEGQKHLLGARNLANLLTSQPSLRLVFLNSCEGARSGEGDAFSSAAITLVRQGVPAVVAMQYEITDKAATEFARSFYWAIVGGLPVDAAVAVGRTSLSNKVSDTLEWGTPVLYMRSSDGRVFDVSTKEDSRHQYREAVELAWANGELTRGEASWLSQLTDRLGLSSSTAAEIEREAMGDTKETRLERQKQAAGEECREARPEMEERKPQSVKLFYSYSHRDERYLNKLKTGLAPLRRQGLIEEWHDREIVPGQQWEELVDENIKAADIILLLITPDFMGSNYAYEKEMSQALERHERGEAYVIPIIVSPTHWEEAPLYKLQVLPKDAKPITTWSDQDRAWLDVIEGIWKAVEELASKSSEHERKQQARQELVELPTVKVPDLRGQNTSQASSILADSSLKLGTLNKAPSTTIPEGEIIRQTPKVGTEVEAGSLVSVAVSSGLLAAKAQYPAYPPSRRSSPGRTKLTFVQGLLSWVRSRFANSTERTPPGSLTDRTEHNVLLHRYREAVESVWADKELNAHEAEWLSELASNRLGLSRSSAAEIEHQVMGATKEEILERQNQEPKRSLKPDSLKLFCSYSHKDETYLDDLKISLVGLVRQGLINEWNDREILAGEEWEEVIDEILRTSEIILLLVSPHFMASHYTYEKEMKRALDRHERGEARVIPIIIRPTDWEWAPFSKLQVLPKNAIPVAKWPDRDDAWLDVVRGIRKVIKELTRKPSEH